VSQGAYFKFVEFGKKQKFSVRKTDHDTMMFSISRVAILVGVLLLIAGASLLYDEIFLFSQSKVAIPFLRTNSSAPKTLSSSWRNSRNSSSGRYTIKNTTLSTPVHNDAQEWDNDQKNTEKRMSTTTADGKDKIVSILLDPPELEDDEWFARLAFAKLLQLEAASPEYGIPTEIVIVAKNNASSNWAECFSNMQFKKITHSASQQEQSLDDLLERKELEQQLLFGVEKSLLLKVTADSYRDGLYLIKEHFHNGTTEHDEGVSGISLPFFSIGVPPNWSEWTRMEELKHFMQVNPSCCSSESLQPPTTAHDGRKHSLPQNGSVVYLDKHSTPQLNQLMELLSPPNDTSVVLLSSHPTSIESIGELKKSKAFNLEPFCIASSFTRYCTLQQRLPNGFDLVASLDSPLAQWVSVTMNNTSTNVRLISKLIEEKKKDPSEIPTERLPIAAPGDLTQSNALGNVTPIQRPNQSPLPVLGHSDNPISLVIVLGGEMGNQISMIAHGYSLKWMLEEDYNISAVTMLKHQEHGKWVRARASMVTCFPNARLMNFEAGNVPDYNDYVSIQRRWLGNRLHDMFTLTMQTQEAQIRESLDALAQLLSNTTLVRPVQPPNASFTLPFVISSSYATMGYVNDRYYDRLRDLFRFDYDNPKCCGIEKPQANETVMHVRGFNGEMRKKFKKRGYEELSPNKTRDELLKRSASRNDVVTFLSRYASTAAPYLETLQASGWKNARFLLTDTGEQSFCYLIRAQKEMIGVSMSSYAAWGALLGNATKARIYSLKSPERIAVYGDDGCFFRYNYTTPSLREKMSFEVYRSETQDSEEQRQMDILKSGNPSHLQTDS
jgi:hypothetical protein